MISFGKIAEFMESQSINTDEVSDTNEFKQYLEETFPQLKGMKYILAVDKKIVQVNTAIKNNSTIAVMPPFSGG